MPTTQTAGQALAAALRYYLSIGTRTRRYRARDGYRQDLHREMIEAIMLAAQYPGAHSERIETALRPGFGTALAYQKHVQGYRIDGSLAYEINSMTPGSSPRCSARWSTRVLRRPARVSGSSPTWPAR